jgi:3-oxoacyl-[acyl-carrier-protein] synthase-1/3-oxoacyl-[acyl-carrier-protein] synthase II
MALGEGAAVVALSPAGAPGRSLGYVAGFGASTDAIHLTAPDPSGKGLARAASLALADAGVTADAIDLVGAHATATAFNDPAEVKALHAALGRHRPEVVHPFKAQIGHTLGAAGILESLALLDAMARDIAPAAAGAGELDPECSVPLLEKNRRLCARSALKLSSAFGGTNAALVLTTGPSDVCRRNARDVFLVGFTSISQSLDADALAARHPHAHRLDRMSKLVISAVGALAPRADLRGAGLVLGHALATLEHNAVFDARRRERGARFVEPRRFPATSPNAASGECAIAFQLTGPTFAVGASLHGGLEALAVARDLVAVGDAATMLVVAADVGGDAASALLSGAGAGPLEEGACVALLSCESGPGARRLPDELPASLAQRPDWAWAPPYGHTELETYLRGLR